ncbi:hypothetical protein PILCRDRAFT_11425 [Piloderma croceum F 1598]|uniref:Uncharacterized protein n=1 Tax=Piloderma croceum (strain F 1598) TaxID=765440 RepID=A0A0C3FE95_PILCF|nr:hypothetical protein PILCRDRAFT_11425 [Piloderma croceum F 1598]
MASATRRAYWMGLGLDTDDIGITVDFKGSDIHQSAEAKINIASQLSGQRQLSAALLISSARILAKIITKDEQRDGRDSLKHLAHLSILPQDGTSGLLSISPPTLTLPMDEPDKSPYDHPEALHPVATTMPFGH